MERDDTIGKRRPEVFSLLLGKRQIRLCLWLVGGAAARKCGLLVTRSTRSSRNSAPQRKRICGLSTVVCMLMPTRTIKAFFRAEDRMERFASVHYRSMRTEEAWCGTSLGSRCMAGSALKCTVLTFIDRRKKRS